MQCFVNIRSFHAFKYEGRCCFESIGKYENVLFRRLHVGFNKLQACTHYSYMLYVLHHLKLLFGQFLKQKCKTLPLRFKIKACLHFDLLMFYS